MVAVVIHPKLTLDDLGDTRRRPQVGSVAVRQWSLEEQLHQTAPFGGSELRRASRGRADPQRLCAASAPSLEPPHYRTGRTMDAPPDLVE